MNDNDTRNSADISIRMIVECAAVVLGVPARDILSRRRHADAVAARHAVVWVARKLTARTSPQIGGALSRDHTTVLNSLSVAEERRSRDPAFASALAQICAASIALARSEHAAQYADVDVVAVAGRVARNPQFEALRVSTLELIAVCDRLLALEDIAGGAFQLICKLDGCARYSPQAELLIETLTSALSALGYSKETLHGEDESQDGGAAVAGAAD